MLPLKGRTKDTRTPQQLLADLVRAVLALDPSRGICDLAASTSRQLLELERCLGLLTLQRDGSLLSASRNQVSITRETLAALEASPSARAAVVQLFSSALRLVALDGTSAAAGAAPTCNQGCSKSSTVEPKELPSARPGGSSAKVFSSVPSPPASARPTGPSPQRFRGILTATAHLLTEYLDAAATKQRDAFGNEFALVQESTTTVLALLRGDALAGLSRLMAVEHTRDAGAKLLMDTHDSAINEMVLQICRSAVVALCREGGQESALRMAALGGLSRSHVFEQWAAHTLRRPTSAAAASDANGQEHLRLWLLEVVFLQIRDIGRHSSDAAATATIRQLLSGPCLQYCRAVQAVSQLHAADGGPLYGLPYDALLAAVLSNVRTGQLRRPLSFAPLSCAVSFWGACIAYDPPVPLHHLRPRHVLALCLRTARVALGSLGQLGSDGSGGATAAAAARAGRKALGSLGGGAAAAALNPKEHEQQQQQQQHGETTLEVRGKKREQQQQRQGQEQQQDGGSGSGGGAAVAGTGQRRPGLAWVYGGGRGGLRQVLDTRECAQLALSAMMLATKMLRDTSTTSSRASSNTNSNTSGTNSGGQRRGPGCGNTGPAGAASDPAGDVSGSSNAGGSPAAALAAAASGGASGVRSRGAGGGAGGPPLDLLRDPAFAAEWWRLVAGTVRAKLCDLDQKQEQQQLQACVRLLATKECVQLLQAGVDMVGDAGAAGRDPWDGGAPPPVPPTAALDAGYIPCMEAVVRHMYGRHGASVADLSAALGPSSTAGLLLVWRLLHTPSSHARQAAALLSTLGKVLARCGGVQGAAEQKAAAGSPKAATAAAAGGAGWSGASGRTSSSTATSRGRSGSSITTASSAIRVAGHAALCLAALINGATAALGRLSEASSSKGCTSSSGDGSSTSTSASDMCPSASCNAVPGSRGCEAAASDSGGEGCGGNDAGDGECGDPTLQLVSFALPRWLPLCAHLADLCGQGQEEEQGEQQQQGQGQQTQGTLRRSVLTALRGAVTLVLDACTAAHEAGNARALGSWRQLLYDMVSYRWVDERDADMAGLETRWCDRAWSPGQAVGSAGQQEQQQRQQQEWKSQGQREQREQERGAEAEAGATQCQRDGAAAERVAKRVRRRRGHNAGLQQRGTGQEEVETEQPEQHRLGKEQPQEHFIELLEQGQAQGQRQERQGTGQAQQEQERGEEQIQPQCETRQAVDECNLPYHLLPLPCDAELLWPSCCYPLCTNLAGDSEAGVQLGTGGDGGEEGGESGGGGGSLYCSGECRTAHARFRREQEAKEVGWRVRRWGQGS